MREVVLYQQYLQGIVGDKTQACPSTQGIGLFLSLKTSTKNSNLRIGLLPSLHKAVCQAVHKAVHKAVYATGALGTSTLYPILCHVLYFLELGSTSLHLANIPVSCYSQMLRCPDARSGSLITAELPQRPIDQTPNPNIIKKV